MQKLPNLKQITAISQSIFRWGFFDTKFQENYKLRATFSLMFKFHLTLHLIPRFSKSTPIPLIFSFSITNVRFPLRGPTFGRKVESFCPIKSESPQLKPNVRVNKPLLFDRRPNLKLFWCPNHEKIQLKTSANNSLRAFMAIQHFWYSRQFYASTWAQRAQSRLKFTIYRSIYDDEQYTAFSNFRHSLFRAQIFRLRISIFSFKTKVTSYRKQFMFFSIELCSRTWHVLQNVTFE